jgi:uncharacterized LabA/DUF88 family protein
VRNDLPAEQRQQIYLNALAAHCSLLEVRQGRFQQKSKTCYSCGFSYTDYEEKESDVSLAVSLVEDGVLGIFDTALIVSADGDMAPGIRALKRLKPNVKVIAAFPPNRRAPRLEKICDVAIPIGEAKVRQAQLPETIMAGQHAINRPDHWK